MTSDYVVIENQPINSINQQDSFKRNLLQWLETGTHILYTVNLVKVPQGENFDEVYCNMYENAAKQWGVYLHHAFSLASPSYYSS